MPRAEPTCAACRDTGFRVEESSSGHTRAVPCECRRAERADRLVEQARIPKRFQRCEFANYDEMSTSHKLAKLRVERFAREYYPASPFGLLLMGPPGLGKTHLAVALIHHLMREKGVGCLFYDFQDLLKEIQNSYNPTSGTSETSVLQPIFASEVLVLDDLGARKPTVWVEETLTHIISTRYNDVKTTVFTTNYLDSPPPERERVTLTERIGERVRSRLHEMCQVVQIDGEDYRVESKKADFHP